MGGNHPTTEKNLKSRVAQLVGLTTIPKSSWKSLPLDYGKDWNLTQPFPLNHKGDRVMCCDAPNRATNCFCYENYNLSPRGASGKEKNEEEQNRVRIVCEVVRDYKNKQAEDERTASAPAAASGKSTRRLTRQALVDRFICESIRCQQS